MIPRAALDGGADGLDAYRALIPQAAGLLAPGGALVVEAGQGQSGADRRFDDGSGVIPDRPRRRLIWRAFRGPSPAEIAPIKPDWNAKKPLGIFARERLRSGSQHRRRSGPVDVRVKARVLEARARPVERFQNAGPFERNSSRAAPLRPQSERKPDIALDDLRKKTRAWLALAG